MFLHWGNDQKHCILLKATFEIPLFPIKDVLEQSPVFNYYKHGLRISADDAFNKSYAVVTFFTSSLISFFNVLFSKYVLKILATFLVKI